MNGLDEVDQSAAYYPIFDRKTLKWSMKLIQINSHVPYYKTHGTKLALAKFKRFLIDQLDNGQGVRKNP